MNAALPRTVDEALAHVRRCDALPFPSRSRSLAMAARGLSGPVFERVHAALDGGDLPARHTALFLAVARRDLDRIEAALADPLLRRRAMAAAVRLPVRDAALADLVWSEPPLVRRAVYGLLRRSRRRPLADALLPEVARRFGDRDAAALLPACSPATVAAWLPALPVPSGTLRSLARSVPEAVARQLVERYGPDHRFDVARRDRETITLLARRSPAAALVLLEHRPLLMTPAAMVEALRNPLDVLAVIRRTRPARIALAGDPLPRAVVAALRRCPPVDLVELSAAVTVSWPHRRGGDPAWTHPLLALVPPAERLRVATGIVLARVSDGPLTRPRALAAFVALEPDDRLALYERLRVHESRYRGGEQRYLPLPTAEPDLLSQATSPRHTTRRWGWSALIECAQRHGDPHEYARVLGLAERAWHDRGAVRTAALEQAAATPPGLLGAVPLPVLRAATDATVQLADSARTTVACLVRWLHRTAQRALDRRDRERAAEVVALLVATATAQHRVPLRPLVLDPPVADALWARLADGLDQPVEAVALAELLRRHLPTAAVNRMSEIERAGGPAAVAASRLLLADPATRDDRVAEIAAAARPAAVDAALTTLATRRTDLLDTLLDRVSADRVHAERWLRAVPAGARGRWTPEQQRRWQRLLAEIAADRAVGFPARAAVTARITDTDALLGLCRSAAHPVRAAALAALADTAAVERAVTELLDAAPLAGARGRAALAGLRRLVARLPEPRALALCADVLLDGTAGVGARKAAARALRDVGLPGRVRDVLHAVWERPDLHRDLRATVATCLLGFVDDPGTAARLRAWLTDPEVRRAVFEARPTDMLPAQRSALAGLVLGALWHPDDQVRAAACEAYAGVSGSVDGLERIAELLTDPDLPWAARRACLDVLIWRSNTSEGTPAWRSGLDTASVRGPERMRALLADVIDRGFHLPSDYLDALATTLVEAGFPTAAAHCAHQAGLQELDAGRADAGRWLRYLELVGGHLHRARRSERFAHYRSGAPPAEAGVTALLGRLDDAGGPVAGMAAVDILAQVGAWTGWVERWRAELDARRSAPDPDVAEAAWLVDPEQVR